MKSRRPKPRTPKRLPARDFPIIEYDPSPTAIIEPSRVYKRIDVPKHCVLCFFQDVIDELVRTGRPRDSRGTLGNRQPSDLRARLQRPPARRDASARRCSGFGGDARADDRARLAQVHRMRRRGRARLENRGRPYHRAELGSSRRGHVVPLPAAVARSRAASARPGGNRKNAQATRSRIHRRRRPGPPTRFCARRAPGCSRANAKDASRSRWKRRRFSPSRSSAASSSDRFSTAATT